MFFVLMHMSRLPAMIYLRMRPPKSDFMRFNELLRFVVYSDITHLDQARITQHPYPTSYISFCVSRTKTDCGELLQQFQEKKKKKKGSEDVNSGLLKSPALIRAEKIEYITFHYHFRKLSAFEKRL